jgi:hypothetical protein
VATFEIMDMEKGARGVVALLGSGLVVVWMFAVGYGHSGWLSWTMLAAAVVALGGLGPAAMDTEAGVATWPFVGVLLLSAWLFALAVGATPWLAWSSFAFGCAFVILTTVFTVASGHIGPFDRHHHVHGRA